MMAISNNKKATLLQKLKPYLNTLNWHLYKNNYTPADVSTTDDFTEVTDGGYAPLETADFHDAIFNELTMQAVIEADAWETTFFHDEGNFTVYGWYATDPEDGEWVFAERAASPTLVDEAGFCYFVIPKIVLGTLCVCQEEDLSEFTLLSEGGSELLLESGDDLLFEFP